MCSLLTMVKLWEDSAARQGRRRTPRSVYLYLLYIYELFGESLFGKKTTMKCV